MSQQINLLLPALRPKFDWLGLPLLVGGSVAGLAVVVAAGLWSGARLTRLQEADAALKAQLQAAQTQVVALGQTLAGRQPDPALPDALAAARQEVAQRQEVLDFIGRGAAPAGRYGELLSGFSRQTLGGVWLVGFSFAGQGVELRGRLTDPALLPRYIDKLDADPAFAGRRFSALDMAAVTPVRDLEAAGRGKAAPAGPPFTEFVLRSELLPVQEKTP